MEEINIIPGTAEQMEEVTRVFQASRLHSQSYLPILHTYEETVFFFREIVFKSKQVFFATSAKNEVLGFIAFDREWIDHLYLLPEAQGKGIGSRLIEVAKKDSSHLRLWTFQKNIQARCFYKKHGFKVIQETDGFGNEEKEPDLLFEWRSEQI